MSQINVCHVSTLTRWGGVESRLVEYLAHSKDRRLRHCVIATSAIDEIVQEICKVGVPVFIPQRRFHYDPTAMWQMVRWMRTQRIDIVHTRNCVANCWGGLAAVLARVPVLIGGEHGTVWFAKHPMTWIERWIYRRAQVVVANSEASKTMLVHKRGLSTAQVRVIYNAVAFPGNVKSPEMLRHELGVTQNEMLVGTIGRLHIQKDPLTLLRAARLVVRDRDRVRFIIVGGGPLAEALKRQAQLLNIGRKVIFTGWRRDAQAILRLFDVYVVTSVNEPFGNTLVEAALAKKPVIAPRVDGIPEVVKDSETGLLLEPSDAVRYLLTNGDSPLAPEVIVNGFITEPRAVSAEELAQKINYLLDNPGLRRSLGEAGFERARKLFSLERYIKELESTYLSLYLESEPR